jgi:hypothetical protein
MNTYRISRLASLLVACAVGMAGVSFADPLPGRDLLKFSQRPMDQTAIVGQIYWGHDELSTAYAPIGAPAPTAYRGRFTADDFADTLTTPVVHVKWWGSYLNGSDQFGHATKFLIAFESDIPNPNPLGFSYPDPQGPIHSQIVTLGALLPQSGTFTEKFVSPGGTPLNEALYEYNAELAIPFPQQKDTVHWLKIVALVDHAPTINPLDPNAPVTRWGWHNRDYTQQDVNASPAVSPGENQQGTAASGPIWHFQDDAVSGEVNVNTFINTAGLEQVGSVVQFLPTFVPQDYVNNADGPQGISNFSQDQAFELYTVQIPEPATCLLTVVGLLGIVASNRSSRR